MSKKSIGIIGCGLISDTHVETIKKIVPNAAVSVCDPIPGKAELLRKKYALKSNFSTIEEMLLRENPFCVHVLSPPQFHVDHTLQCLEAGCHVLVEKPLAFHSRDVDKLYDAAQKHNRILCVNHSLFYQPSILKMFKKMKLNSSRNILYVNIFYGLDLAGTPFLLAPKGHWKHDLPGGPITDVIVHPVTLAVQMTGKPIDIKVNFFGSEDNPREIFISWIGEKAIASIIISSQAQPFRRVTEVTTTKETFIVDHSTETLVSLGAGFGPKSLQKLLRNFGYAAQLVLGTTETVIQVVRGKLSQNPGTRGLVEAYYRHLAGDGEIPVSKENVWESVYALEKIVAAFTPTGAKQTTGTRKPKINRNHDSRDESPTKTLVTGASGFLGSRICEILAEKKRGIIAQVRRSLNAEKLHSPYITKIFEDFNYEPVNYDYLARDINEIVHCAHAAGAKTWQEVKKTNIDATISLYEAAARAGCEKFIFLSSVAVYGVHQREKISVDEESAVILGKSKWDFYVRSKTMAEKLLLEKAQNGGPKLLIIRPGILYSGDGMRLTKKSISLRDRRLLIGFGNGKNHLPYTRVDVLSETICKTLDLDIFPEGIYNMTGNPEDSSKEFIYKRMNNLSISCSFFMIPAFPLRILASLMEFVHTFMHKKTQPKITRYIIDSHTRDIYYDCSKAQRQLGWDQAKAIAL